MATIALATLGSISAAHAADAEKDAAVEEILVTGKHLEESVPLELSQLGNRIQLIQSDAIEKRAVNDVAQALQLLAPSLYIQPKSGAFDYVEVSLEGSRTGDILWLVDGVRINNRLYNGTTPLDTIPAAMVERIEVLEGGQGLFYGTQAVAGVINVITKSLTKQTSGQVTVGVDTNEGRHVSGYVRSATGPHEFVVYASSDEATGYQAFPTEDYQPSATDRRRGYDVQTAGVKYGIDLSDELRFSAGYQRTHAVLDFANPNLIALYFNERDEDLGNAKIDWKPSEEFSLFLKGYYHNWKSTINRFNNSLTSPGTVLHVRDHVFWGYKDYGLNALAKYTVHDGVDLYAGYDFQNYSGHDDSLKIGEQTEQVHALFGQVRTTPDLFENLRMSAGLRYNKPKSGKAITIWNASGQYDIGEHLYVRATAGTAYRLPDASELYSIDPCCEIGNPSLQGEKSNNINASVGGSFELGGTNGTWELVGFTRKVENLIAAVPNASGVAVYQNTPGSTRVDGYLVTATLQLGQEVSASATYSATNAKTKGRPGQIDRVPEATAKASLDYHPSDLPIGGSINVNYFGTTAVTLSGGLGRQTYGDVTTADAAAYYVFGPEDRHRITLRIENVTDKTYASKLVRAVKDVGGASYVAHNLGVPRTFHVQYSYDF